MDTGGPVRIFPEVPADLIARLERKVHNLQMLPAVAAEALQLAQDPDCPIGKFAGLVERDLKLATFILRVANSTLYSTSTSIASLHQAVARIGLKSCRGLILTSSFDSLNTRLTADLQFTRERLARHGFLTAILAMRINHHLHLGFQGEEFTAGLMHDLGRTLFAVAVPEQFRMIDPLDFAEPDDVEQRELAAIGAPHTEFGAWFAEFNELPEPLISSIRFHHAPKAAGPWRRMAALTAAADHVANYVQCRTRPRQYDPAENIGIQLLDRSETVGTAERFAALASELIEECPRIADSLMAA